MSKRASLHLLSGTGGSGTTSICAATTDALRAEGLRVARIDGTGTGTDGADPAARELITASVGRVFAELGADPVPTQLWSSLAGIRQLSTLQRIASALDDPGIDAVVVDCGDLQQGRELVELPSILLRLLDATLTPRLAMWRAAADGQATDSVFEAVSAVRDEVARMQQVLAEPETTMRLVTVAESDAVTRTLRALASFALLGISVEGIVANRFPRRSDAAPSAAVGEQQFQLRRLQAGSEGALVWKSTSRIRAVPKGRSARGPLGRVTVLAADRLGLQTNDEEFTLDLPLIGAASGEAVVGRLDDDLVVAFDEVRRWLVLPPVLRRCHATHGVRTPTGLRLHFRPDDTVWRRPDGTGEEGGLS